MDEDSWLMGFFEGQTSFSVNIGLVSTKNKRYVVFKPIINIVSVDDHQVKFIIKFLGLSLKINKKKKSKSYHNDYYSLNVQNFSDIDIILKKLANYKFISNIKQKKVYQFVECYYAIRKIGAIHEKWDDGFVDIIEKKLKINSNRSNIDKNRYNKEEWIKRIDEHLNSV